MMRRTDNSHISNAQDFHGLMQQLLQYMKIAPSAESLGEVYSFTFDRKTEVKLFSLTPDALEMHIMLGVLSDQAAPTVMLNLLHLNRYISEGPCMSIGVDPDSRAVTVWSRHSLVDMDLAKLAGVIRAALSRASLAHACLNGSALGPTEASSQILSLRQAVTC
jgi:hypothetical protein